MYNVPSIALMAGLPGKRIEKILDTTLEVGGVEAALTLLYSMTTPHC